MKCEGEGPQAVEAGPMVPLPPAPGLCPVCAVDHTPDMPHDRDSLYYQARFRQAHGRWPRWSDALAHCDGATRAKWIGPLRAAGVWLAQDDAALADGTAVAEPCP